MAPNGQIKYPEGISSANTKWIPINFRVGNNFLARIWTSDPPDLWAQLDKFNKGAMKSKALGFSFDAEPVKTEVAAVTNVISQYRMGLETGTMDPKVSLPEFITKLKASGIDKIIAEKQAQLDKWAKAAK
jgi:putative aldouronate transport system substrate-binding protein